MESAKKSKSSASKGSPILRAVISGLVAFTVFVLIIPTILMQTEDPSAFVTASAVAAVCVTSFFASLAASNGSGIHFLAVAAITAIVIVLLLLLPSFAASGEKNYAFAAVVGIAAIVFSLFGAKTGKREKKKKRRR